MAKPNDAKSKRVILHFVGDISNLHTKLKVMVNMSETLIGLWYSLKNKSDASLSTRVD